MASPRLTSSYLCLSSTGAHCHHGVIKMQHRTREHQALFTQINYRDVQVAQSKVQLVKTALTFLSIWTVMIFGACEACAWRLKTT